MQKKIALLMILPMILSIGFVSAGYNYYHDDCYDCSISVLKPKISPDVVYIQRGLYTEYKSCFDIDYGKEAYKPFGYNYGQRNMYSYDYSKMNTGYYSDSVLS